MQPSLGGRIKLFHSLSVCLAPTFYSISMRLTTNITQGIRKTKHTILDNF